MPTDYSSSGQATYHLGVRHRPTFYRYTVADPGLRVRRNGYANQHSAVTIGLAVVIGRKAYCVKWATARIRFGNGS